MPPALWPWFRLFTLCKCVENCLGCFWCQVLIKIIIDDHHWRVATGTLTLNLDHSELPILGCPARLNAAKVTTDSVKDIGRPTKHARRRGADLDEVLTYWLTVEHRVEGCYFIHAHGRHLQKLRNIIHYADTCPALVLTLSKVKERDDSCFLVLWGIPGDDFFS